MRLFLLSETIFDIIPCIIEQKILDLVQAGTSSAHLQFYIVGDSFSNQYIESYHSHSNVTILKKYQAEKLITQVTNAIVVHFGNTLKGSKQFPQYFIPLSTPWIHSSGNLIQRLLKKYRFKKFITTSAGAFCLNDWTAFYFEKQFSAMVPLFKNAYLPLSKVPSFEWVHLEAIKSDVAQGNNYFLSFISMEDFKPILKEFSFFKKWQQSNMFFVLVFDDESQCQLAIQALKGYKYKESVVIKNAQALQPDWIAASYAIIWSNINFDKTTLIEWAIRYNVPLLFDINEKQPASWLGAGEVFSFKQNQDLASHFKLYYKDEMYKEGRSKMGKDWAEQLAHIDLKQALLKLPIDLKS